MQLNKVLQAENDRLKEEVKELRDESINDFMFGWHLFEENQRLWEVLDGLACELVLYRLGYVHISNGSEQLLCLGLNYPGKETK